MLGKWQGCVAAKEIQKLLIMAGSYFFEVFADPLNDVEPVSRAIKDITLVSGKLIRLKNVPVWEELFVFCIPPSIWNALKQFDLYWPPYI